MRAKKRAVTPKQPKSSRPQAPGYGFPKGAKGLLSWSWAEQRLKKSHNYWITTVKPDGAPHTMVVWGLWQDGRFLFSTGGKSQKARNLGRNAGCIVCTEDADEAVIVEGVAEIADVHARRKFLGTYTGKYKFDMSSMEDDILSMKEPVFAVRPKKASAYTRSISRVSPPAGSLTSESGVGAPARTMRLPALPHPPW
jgi:hypothetical protein